MFTKNTLVSVSGILLLIAMSAAGCSSESKAKPEGFVARVVDTLAEAVVESLYEASTIEIETPAVAEQLPIESMGAHEIADLVTIGDVIYAASDIGLITVDMSDGAERIIRTESRINALCLHAGKLYVGGDSLWELNIDSLIPVDGGMVGVINCLQSYGPTLMVGTTFGLYSKTVIGFIQLLDEMDITSIAVGNRGVWVGTLGHGLYWYNGREFRQRYLARDTSLFDFVNCLAFSHDHLYLGTSDGLYIYDGGRWKTITATDGLPSNDIRSVDASSWTVLIGTSEGVVTYFNNEIKPVSRLENQSVEVVRSLGHRILVGTSGKGLLIKSGPAVKVVTGPVFDGA